MKTILLAGAASLVLNLLIVSASIPLAIGFRPVIIFQIAFWTFFAATGATITMIIMQTYAAHPERVFLVLACIVFSVSLIPIYLHAGIFHDFPQSLSTTVAEALITMHISDSLVISAFVIGLARRHRTAHHVSDPAGA